MLLRMTIPTAAQENGNIPHYSRRLDEKFSRDFLSRLAHLSVFSFYYNCVDMETTHRVLVNVLTL